MTNDSHLSKTLDETMLAVNNSAPYMHNKTNKLGHTSGKVLKGTYLNERSGKVLEKNDSLFDQMNFTMAM